MPAEPDQSTPESVDDDDRKLPRTVFYPSIYPNLCACLEGVKDAAIKAIADLQLEENPATRSKLRADINMMFGQRSWDCINYFGGGFHWGGGGETSLEEAREFWTGSPNNAVNPQSRK